MTTRFTVGLFALALAASAPSIQAETATIHIDAAKPGPEINPRMYGIFLEEINTGVDGGLYAEMIRNRGFEDAKAPEGFSFINGRWDNGRGYVIPYHFEVDKSLPYWSLMKEGGAQGSIALDQSQPLDPATPRSCRLQIDDLSAGRTGIANAEMMLTNMIGGGMISPHDYRVAKAAATALCGGDVETGSKVTEEWLLAVERREFVALLKTPETQARIRQMMETGKPLRN